MNENKRNILEYVSTQLSKQMEANKTIAAILSDINRDMVDLVEKVDKVLKKYEVEENE